MRCGKRWAALAFLVFAVPFSGAALGAGLDCPTLDRQELEKLLADAPSCDRSMDLFRICAYGASGDVGLGIIVVEKCERDFLTKLTRSERRTYEGHIRTCGRKYARETGTLYRSFEAFCAAGVAQAYARRAASGKPFRKQ